MRLSAPFTLLAGLFLASAVAAHGDHGDHSHSHDEPASDSAADAKVTKLQIGRSLS